MHAKIEKIKKIRQFLLAQIAVLTPEQLNKIPAGYNNNIIWNLAHLICAQQSLCYVRAGQSIIVDEKYFLPYTTGTRPTAIISEQEIDEIKTLFIDSIDRLQSDFEQHLFEHYVPSENIARVYGVELRTIEDALDFLLYHEGFHSGYIISLMHLVR